MAKQFKGIAADFINAMKTQFIGMGADPNEIVVQDLYNYAPQQQNSAIKNLLKNKGSLNELAAMSTEDRNILSSILAIYNEHISTKREILTQARNLFDTDIVQTVIDVMIDDGFNSFNNENEEFIIEYRLDEDDLNNLGEEYEKQIQNEIDEFVEKFGLKTKVAEIVPELLRDGEYAFGVLYDNDKKKGITQIVDDFDVINLLPFYENDKLSFVINQNHFDNKNTVGGASSVNAAFAENQCIAYNPENIVFFRLKGQTKLRINMSNFYNKEFRDAFYERTHIKLPKYVRTSLPIYYSAMKTLNRLKIMENVSTVLDIMDVLKPEIVHVSVPTTTSERDAKQIIRDYERNLNDVSGFDMGSDAFDISSLAAQANRRKVLPQWIEGKGSLTSAGINQSGKGSNAWDSIDKLRNLAALNIGIPPYYINISGTPIDKAQTIKLYSRYTRKLTSLQKTLADGVKDFILLHLSHKGLNISRSNLVVKFKAITSGDALDDTDLLVGLVTGLNDLYKALDEITASERNNLVLDDEQFKKLFDKITSTYLNTNDLIKIDDNKFIDLDGNVDTNGDFEPIGSPSGEHGTRNVTGPSIDISTSSSSSSGDSSYASFVQDTNDIGQPGTEPAIEEI